MGVPCSDRCRSCAPEFRGRCCTRSATRRSRRSRGSSSWFFSMTMKLQYYAEQSPAPRVGCRGEERDHAGAVGEGGRCGGGDGGGGVGTRRHSEGTGGPRWGTGVFRDGMERKFRVKRQSRRPSKPLRAVWRSSRWYSRRTSGSAATGHIASGTGLSCRWSLAVIASGRG